MKRIQIACTLTFLILSVGCQTERTDRDRSGVAHAQVTIKETDGGIAPKPPVMLGVNMIPSGPILEKHLGIDGEMSTMIIAVGDETPASESGLELWDVVVGVNGSREASPSDLRTTLRASEPGDVLNLEILRGTKTLTLEVVLVEADHDRMVPLPIGTDGT